MTMQQKLEIHCQIERENERKLTEWKKQPRSYYTIKIKDGDGDWKIGLWRIGYGRVKARMMESLYRRGGFQTQMIKETFVPSRGGRTA